MKVILCAGGTGGHLFPALALAESFKKRHHEVTIITDSRGEVYCEDYEDKLVLNSVKLSVFSIFGLFFQFVRMVLWFLSQSDENKPDVIVGFGGILTVIPVLVAHCFGVRVVLYEQNSVIGKANRFLLTFSDMKLSKFSIGGNWKIQASPVRKEFSKTKTYKINDKLKILIIGGSQGAKSFSTIIPNALARLSDTERFELELIQQDSYGDKAELKNKYEKLGVKATIEDFIDNVGEIMSDCQLVICRAGASTLSELEAVGRPAILIPYPNAADNHQVLNAKRYVAKNAAWLVTEDSFASDKLSKIIKDILKDKESLKLKATNMYNEKVRSASEDFVQLIEILEN